MKKEIAEKSKVVLYCMKNRARKFYLIEMERLSANFKLVSTFIELQDLVQKDRYNGIMVDVGTIMRAPKKDRVNFQKLKDLFPVVQLNWNKEDETIGTLFYGSSSSAEDLESFLKRECIPFKPRSVRKNSRKRVHLNTLMARNDNFSAENIERTVTLDISKTGCFLYTVDDWIISEKVWILFKELDSKTPIKCRIRRISRWGKATKLPGIGVSFDEISDDQKNQIINMLE
ncbi:MAG: PilZ domain-containing protein [Desulfobacterales bacterium]|nr:PilZ domain-containing protein [Desulfobacterales bacterium]MCP4160270.1 PilZ domain-containing protein [Deltaproteobacteria bacterium]